MYPNHVAIGSWRYVLNTRTNDNPNNTNTGPFNNCETIVVNWLFKLFNCDDINCVWCFSSFEIIPITTTAIIPETPVCSASPYTRIGLSRGAGGYITTPLRQAHQQWPHHLQQLRILQSRERTKMFPYSSKEGPAPKQPNQWRHWTMIPNLRPGQSL